MAEAAKKAQEAADAGIFGKIFGWIGKIFALIALAVSAVAAIAAGQIATAVLVCIAATMLVMDIMSEISKARGGPGMSFGDVVVYVVKAIGATLSPELQQWLVFGINMIGTVLGIAASFGASAVEAGAEAAKALGKTISAVIGAVQGLTGVGTASSTIAHGVLGAQLSELNTQVFESQSAKEEFQMLLKQWWDAASDRYDELQRNIEIQSASISDVHSARMRWATK